MLAASRVYLDHNAGAPLRPEARTALLAMLAVPGNPSSVHAEGREARRALETARREIASLVGGGRVVFTASATEAVDLALSPETTTGGAARPIGRLYASATEHACVLAGGRFGPGRVTRVSVDGSGRVDLDALDRLLVGHSPGSGAPLVAVQLANSETGVIQPVADAARIARNHGGFLLCDAAQAFGRIPVDMAALGADFLALSSHKIGGPPGAGALVLRAGAPVPAPVLLGGGQESGLRAGTQNVGAIAGFAAAARAAIAELVDSSRLSALRDFLEARLVSISTEATIFGRAAPRLPNTTCFAIPGEAAEAAVIALDLAGIAVSSGSACASGKVGASQVLAAMGVGPQTARAGVRVSLGWSTEPEDVHRFVEAWAELAAGYGRACAPHAARGDQAQIRSDVRTGGP